MGRKREHRRMMRQARKAPEWVRHIASTKVTARDAARYKRSQLGTFGPASPVRRIDPETGKVTT
jgi:hypothetical protein